jgi:hypothetical protein
MGREDLGGRLAHRCERGEVERLDLERGVGNLGKDVRLRVVGLALVS